MQRLIAKYALAAHLALVAVAPLSLSGFFSGSVVATAMLWLSAFAAVWMFMSPSVIGQERLREARRRVAHSFLADPLTWIMLFAVAVAAIRALNGGIKMAYDAETTVWSIAPATFPLLPGTVDGFGYLPFATSAAAMILISACRHALGKAGRSAFCLTAAVLAGATAATELFTGPHGAQPEFHGFAYGIYFLTGTAAMAGAFEHRWNGAMLLFALAIGATGAGLVAFADVLTVVYFLAAEIALVSYVAFHVNATLRKAAGFKLLVVFALSLTIGLFMVLSLVPEDALARKVASILSWELFPENFFEVRSVLSDIAFRSWKVHPWLGSGLASFPLDVRFFAADSDWMVLAVERPCAFNGYWHLLAERGIAGAALLALPLVALLGFFAIAMVKGIMAFRMPHPAALLGLLALAAVVLDAFFGVSFLRPEVMLAVAFSLAVSAKSFPKEKIDG